MIKKDRLRNIPDYGILSLKKKKKIENKGQKWKYDITVGDKMIYTT